MFGKRLVTGLCLLGVALSACAPSVGVGPGAATTGGGFGTPSQSGPRVSAPDFTSGADNATLSPSPSPPRLTEGVVSMTPSSQLWLTHSVREDDAADAVQTARELIEGAPIVVLGTVKSVADGTAGSDEPLLAASLIEINALDTTSETTLPNALTVEFSRPSSVPLRDVQQMLTDQQYVFLLKPLTPELRDVWSSTVMCQNYAYCILE